MRLGRLAPPVDESPRLTYQPQLDGLRAVAVLLVIVHHTLQPARFGGWVGVDVFFVLSGYLITSLLLREIDRDSRVQFLRFYRRRARRLYPPLLIMLVAVLPLALVTGVSLASYTGKALIAGTYVTNLFVDATGRDIGPLTHTWSLALEEQFYLLWPVFLLGLLAAGPSRRTLSRIMLGAGLLSMLLGAGLTNPYGYNMNPVLTGGGLLLGCALGLYPGLIRGAGRAAAGLASVAVLLLAILLGSSVGGTRWAPSVACVAATLLIAHLANCGVVSRWLSPRPLVYLGRISYELYLWHFPLLLLIAQRNGWTAQHAALFALPVTFGAAALSHRLVGRRFVSRVDVRPAARRLVPAA